MTAPAQCFQAVDESAAHLPAECANDQLSCEV